MKLTRKSLRKIILQELSNLQEVNYTYATGPGGNLTDLQKVRRNDGARESGEYVPGTKGTDLSQLKAPASGWESRYGKLARLAFGLTKEKYDQHESVDGTAFEKFWIDRIRDQEAENGNIISWNDKLYAIKFENGKMWTVDSGIYHTIEALGLDDSLFAELDNRVQQHGPIVDYDIDDHTITFKNTGMPWEVPIALSTDAEEINPV